MWYLFIFVKMGCNIVDLCVFYVFVYGEVEGIGMVLVGGWD